MTNLPPLTGREYKLLLDPEGFASTGRGAANKWLEKSLKPVLDAVRCRGAFDAAKARKVRFYDTSRGLLDARGYALRERIDEDEPEKPEVTLKLRTADFFVSGLTPMGATGNVTQEKLEEDIAPIAVMTGDRGGKTARFANPVAVYSRYSQSTKVARKTPETIGDVFASFTDLRADLKGPRIDDGEALTPGPGIDETVYRGPVIELAPGVDAEASLTFWRFRKSGLKVAEISFKYAVGDRMTPAVGRLALSVFARMCEGLAVERRLLSKTRNALPQK